MGCTRTKCATTASLLLAIATFPFVLLALLSDHTSANLINRNKYPNSDLGGAYFRIYYTKAQFCQYENTCFETTTKKLFEDILHSTGCQPYYSGQSAALVFGGMGCITCIVLWFLFLFILFFETHQSLTLRRVIKLVYVATWVFLLISFFVTIGLSYSIKCSSWDGPLSDRFNFEADNLIQYGVGFAWLLFSTLVWGVNERAVVTESELAMRTLLPVEENELKE